MSKRVLVWTLVAIVAGSASSFACSCVDRTLEEKFDDADAVFVGKVVRVEIIDEGEHGVDIVRATLTPLETVKGWVPREVEFVTSNGCCYCAPWFDIAVTYLVFATGEGGELDTSLCAGGGRTDRHQEDLKALGLERYVTE